MGLSAALAAASGCALREPETLRERPRESITRAEDPSRDERYCAWFGEAYAGVLYFGQAAFWHALHGSDGNPLADLEHPGPQPIGRFDLERQSLLQSLEVGSDRSRSGVWDVLPGPRGVVFTTYFEEPGRVDPFSREVDTWREAGLYLNELAAGPADMIVATRYAEASAGGGALVLLDSTGRAVRHLRLPQTPDSALAGKTPAWDPVGDEYWVTTDLLHAPRAQTRDGADPRHPHPMLVLDPEGRIAARYDAPGEEYQFVRFAADGTGWFARVSGSGQSRRRLELLRLPPDARPRRPEAATTVLLDEGFVLNEDFAQDIQLTDDGRAIVTRWSGLVHVVDAVGGVRTARMPSQDEWSLYYTAVLASESVVCATLCADVQVVCTELPR